jgi:uncharacterized RmlC-like cupin family protein
VDEAMVECDAECSGEYEADMDWFASIGKHARRTTFAGNSLPMHILQKAGETIYMPDPLIHAVLNLDTTVAITRFVLKCASL